MIFIVESPDSFFNTELCVVVLPDQVGHTVSITQSGEFIAILKSLNWDSLNHNLDTSGISKFQSSLITRLLYLFSTGNVAHLKSIDL